jgi:large conductance mechanosensitive channel
MGKYMTEFFGEFRKFALKGNVVDMAVGFVIGAAFGNIVASLVHDIIMPLVGTMGKIDFSSRIATIRGVDIRYGVFLNHTLNFLIVAFCIFLVVRQMNRLKQFLPHEEATTKTCPECLSTIPIKAKRCAFCTSTLEE